MSDNPYRGMGVIKLICSLSFMIFGMTAFWKPGGGPRPVYLVFGLLVGLLFTLLTSGVFKLFASLLNGDTRKAYGKKYIALMVWKGMLFLVPFSIMALLAVAFFHWHSAGLFLSAGIMSASTAIVMEISRCQPKPRIKNSILLPMMASLLSMGWLFSLGFLSAIPQWAETLSGFLIQP